MPSVGRPGTSPGIRDASTARGIIEIDDVPYEFRAEGCLYGLYEVQPKIIPTHWGTGRLPEYCIRVLDDSGDTTYVDSTWSHRALAEARLRIVEAMCAGCWLEEY